MATINLARKITKILLDAGKTRDEIKAFYEGGKIIQEQDTDFDPGNPNTTGPMLSVWDDVAIGVPVPSDAQLTALDTDPAFTAFESGEDNRAGRPAASMAELKTEALLKTFLTENRAATLARPDAQKLNIAILCVKHLMRIQLNEHIEDMQA